jgi:KaiC/GvpD/RAD55 family RecA-like ATPase
VWTRFKTEDIDEILSLVDVSARKKLKEDMADLLGQQVENIFRQRPLLFNKELGELMNRDMPNVSFRRETIQRIFHEFYEFAGDNKEAYERRLQQLGINIGVSFSIDVMRFFAHQEKIPDNYKDFLDFWAKFDSTAGWGIISVKQFDLDKMALQVEFKNNFLVNESDNHAHCPFLMGYILGVLGVSFDFIFKALEANRHLTPKKRLIPNSVKEIDDADCVFGFTFIEINSTESFDKFFVAMLAYLKGDNMTAIMALRTAIEFCIKDKLGIPKDSHASFHRILKCLKGLNIHEINYNEIEDAYEKLSQPLHGKDIREIRVEELLETSYVFALEVEGFVFSKGQISAIKESLKEEPRVKIETELKPTLPERVTTGYGELDEMLHGGIPESYPVILTSPLCDERDLLIKRFIDAGTKEGQITFYVTTNVSEARTYTEKIQPNFYLFICNPQADTIIKGSLPNVFKLKGVENVTDISIALTSALRKLDETPTGPRRACLEIVSDLLLEHHALQTRRWLNSTIPELRTRGFTTLAVVNRRMHTKHEVQAILEPFEGWFYIYEEGTEKFLKIRRMRNQKYQESPLALKKEKLEINL